MNSSEKTNEGRESPLVITGMAPLDVLHKRLGLTQKQFREELGIGKSTYDRWRVSGLATSLNHRQAKKLDQMLRTIDLSIQDLPDDLSRRPLSENA